MYILWGNGRGFAFEYEFEFEFEFKCEFELKPLIRFIMSKPAERILKRSVSIMKNSRNTHAAAIPACKVITKVILPLLETYFQNVRENKSKNKTREKVIDQKLATATFKMLQVKFGIVRNALLHLIQESEARTASNVASEKRKQFNVPNLTPTRCCLMSLLAMMVEEKENVDPECELIALSRKKRKTKQKKLTSSKVPLVKRNFNVQIDKEQKLRFSWLERNAFFTFNVNKKGTFKFTWPPKESQGKRLFAGIVDSNPQ